MLNQMLPQAKILIVDDQEANVAVLERLLVREGYTHIRSTTDSRQALKLYTSFGPDLILLDLLMPHLDGYAVLEQLQPAIPSNAYLPILVLTADITPETKQRALASGAKDFLSKPLDLVEVALRIRNLLETRTLHLQLQNQNQILEEQVRERTAELIRANDELTLANARLRTEIIEREQRERELEAIAAVSTALRTARLRAEMLPVILDQLSGLLKAEAAALDIGDPATGEVVTELGRGEWANFTGIRFPPEESLTAHVIATGQPYQNNDVQSDPRFYRPALRGGILAVACAPLITEHQTIGALWIGRTTPILAAEVRLLTAIADIAASAIHRATLHEQTDQQLQRLTTLRLIDQAITSSFDLRVTLNVLLDQITAQLGLHAADVLLLNPYSQMLEYAAGRGFRSRAIERSRLRIGEGHAGRAVLERQAVHIPNLADPGAEFVRAQLLTGENFVAYRGVPLIAKGQVKGVLEVFHATPFHADPEWLDFLEALAGQAAIAIDNAELFNNLQRSNSELALAYDSTLEGWSRAMDLRDRETEGHTSASPK